MKRLLSLIPLLLCLLACSPVLAADWNKPALTDTYANFLSYLDARMDEGAIWFEGTSPTNQPVNAKRFDPSTKRIQKWTGSAWSDAQLDAYSVGGYLVGSGPLMIPRLEGSGGLRLTPSSNSAVTEFMLSGGSARLGFVGNNAGALMLYNDQAASYIQVATDISLVPGSGGTAKVGTNLIWDAGNSGNQQVRYSTTLADPATSIDITGLNLDTDLAWEILFYIPAGGPTVVAFTFNGDSGSNYYGAAAGDTPTSTASIPTGMIASSYSAFAKIHIAGTSSSYRMVRVSPIQVATPTVKDYIYRWNNAANNLTRITFTGTTFPVGTRVLIRCAGF